MTQQIFSFTEIFQSTNEKETPSVNINIQERDDLLKEPTYRKHFSSTFSIEKKKKIYFV